MSQFNYTLPSGANFVMQAPAGTTQTQADLIFYSQVAAGSLVGFLPGQSISAASSAVVNFELSRLDRGTAGVDDTVILAIINGLPTTANIPELIDVPLENPITQANIAEIAGTGFTAPAIGSLTSDQTQALMAQVANTVDQATDEITNETGVGRYGFSCQQLEMAGYVKPGTWQRFLQNNSSTLVEVLNAPGIWTGLNGIDNLTEFFNNINAQNDAQARLMVNGYNSLQAAGVISTPTTSSVSAVRGQVFTGDRSLTSTTTTVTNNVNSRVGALIANSSKYGTQLAAQWSQTSPGARTSGINQNNSNLAAYAGIGIGLLSKIPNLNLGSLLSGTTPGLPSVKTAMDALGKASQFATTAASTLQRGLTNFSISDLTARLPNVSTITSQLQGQITGQATALIGQVQGQATALVGQAQAQATALVGQAQAQAEALLSQAQGQFDALRAQGDSLVASVQKAAGFSNTVNRASVDVAMTKIFGSNKIPVPNLGSNLPDSASIKAALDIGKAETVLKSIQGQGTALLNQAQGLTSQAQGLANQAQGLANQARGQANSLLAQARTAVPQIT
jgi:hypothetical protein